MGRVVKLVWDPEADVWIATSDDIPGLVLEASSFGGLLERVRYAVPELLDLNEGQHEDTDFGIAGQYADLSRMKCKGNAFECAMVEKHMAAEGDVDS